MQKRLSILIGDALGVNVEFYREGAFAPLIDLVGGGCSAFSLAICVLSLP